MQLGIDTSSVEHPVMMSERLCTPLHSRTLTSELMFESYNVPSLAYCVDASMSFYQNSVAKPMNPESSGLIISFNTASTSITPVLRGKCIMKAVKRIPWGSQQASEYLLKLLQPKYPTFPARLTTLQTSWMVRNVCSFAPDYREFAKSLREPDAIRQNETIIQFPFTAVVAEEKSEEELQRIAEKRREQGKKLQEIAAKARMDKLLRKESDLLDLLSLKARKDSGGVNKREYLRLIEGEGFEDEASLEETIKKLEVDLKKARKKEADGGEDPVEEPSFPLVDVPDVELDEDGLKEKKKQRLMKAGFDARQRAKLEKEKEKEEKEREERKEEADRNADLQGWAGRLKKDQEALMAKIKERARRKAALSDRKSAAAQARMKNIASLAAEDRAPKKKRKGGGDDMFGADDADWAIYRKINTAAASSDEEDDLNELQQIEQKLLSHDPSFTAEQTFASLTSQKSALMSAFRPNYEEGDAEGLSRIHLSTEKSRVCEAWFSPTMAGVDSAGLAEVVQSVLAGFSNQDKALLANNVLLTGGSSQLPGLQDRLYASLRCILPPEMNLQVKLAEDPQLDSWKGMAAFARTPEFNGCGVTRAEYNEWGGEIVKRWWGSNWNSAR